MNARYFFSLTNALPLLSQVVPTVKCLAAFHSVSPDFCSNTVELHVHTLALHHNVAWWLSIAEVSDILLLDLGGQYQLLFTINLNHCDVAKAALTR